MKWMLITAMLSNPVVYDNQSVCEQALDQIQTKDKGAICIPWGNTFERMEMDNMMNSFVALVKELKELELQNNLDNQNSQ